MSDTVIVVPTYMRTPQDLEVTLTMLESLRKVEPDVEVRVVDDGSPVDELAHELEQSSSRFEFHFTRKLENTGFAKAVNVGLAYALEHGKNGLLLNADMTFSSPFVERMEEQRSELEPDQYADVVGGLLTFPSGLIQHGGIFFSLLHRCFDHRFKYAPENLPEAQQAFTCPVTGAMQFIRLSTMQTIGIYDEAFFLGWEDVDYCLRVFNAGGTCVYQPKVRAIHYESMFRGRPSPKVADWQRKSYLLLMEKHGRTNFAPYVPAL